MPLAGALFTAEIMIGVITLPVALPALVCSGIATLTAWVYLPAQATYLGVPDYPFTMSALVWAVLVGPVIGLVAVVFIRLIGFVSHHRARGKLVLVAPLGAFGVGCSPRRWPPVRRWADPSESSGRCCGPVPRSASMRSSARPRCSGQACRRR